MNRALPDLVRRGSPRGARSTADTKEEFRIGDCMIERKAEPEGSYKEERMPTTGDYAEGGDWQQGYVKKDPGLNATSTS